MILENGLVWLGVHGNLCLALRHPQNRGASRSIMIDFVKRLGRLLVIYGVVSEEELKRAERLEIAEGSKDLGDKS